MTNTDTFERAAGFLTQIKPTLSVQLQNDINSQNVSLVNQVIAIRKEITGGGTIDLLDANSNRQDGICDFDKNQLNPGRALIFDEATVGYANDAAAGKEGVLAYTTTMPVELKAATLLLKVNDKEVFRMPLCDLNNAGTSAKTSDFYVKLKAYAAIVDNKNIALQIKMAPGVSLAAGSHHYIKVAFSGLQTAVRG